MALLSERYAPYVKAPNEGGAPEPSDFSRLTADQIRVAREAVSKAEGTVRFLRQRDEEFAADLVELFDAVAPVVRSHE